MEDGLRPVGLAMVVCDNIHIDPGTGKRTLLGTFWAIHCKTFPAVVPMIAVYVAATEFKVSMSLAMRIVDVGGEREPILEIRGESDIADPLAVLEANYLAANVAFPEPGEYRVQFLAGGSLIIERRLIVAEFPLESPAEEKNDE
jgi:hypothetical protein